LKMCTQLKCCLNTDRRWNKKAVYIGLGSNNKISPGDGETICPPMPVRYKIAADLRPSADGRRSLVAGGG